MSFLLFILAAEEIMRIAQRVGVISYADAEYIAIGSKDIKKLQETINDTVERCYKHEFEINISKTEMMNTCIGRNTHIDFKIAVCYATNKR